MAIKKTGGARFWYHFEIPNKDCINKNITRGAENEKNGHNLKQDRNCCSRLNGVTH